LLKTETSVEQLKEKIQDSNKLLDSFSRQYDEIVTWADMFGDCDMETKKMVLARIMSNVSIKRDYDIEITFTVGFEQFGGLAHAGSITTTPTVFTPQKAS